MLVLSSPSGAGKTTISNLLLSQNNETLVRSISVTTRTPRASEIDGKDYFFVDERKFLELCHSGKMLEHAKVFDNYYGIPRGSIEINLKKGIDVLFSIDWQGAFRLIENMRKNVVSVFILPPSMHELEKRLNKRGDENSHVIKSRLDQAFFETTHCYNYDYVIINHDVEDSVDKIQSILKTEKLKVNRQINLDEFINEMFDKKNCDLS